MLMGDVPLDKEDEGFDSIGVPDSIQDIYSFFKNAVNSYEQHIAQKVFEEEKHGSQPTASVDEKNSTGGSSGWKSK